MAFFLEAAFLGVLLFGRSLVPRWAHFYRRRAWSRSARCSRLSGSSREQLDADSRRLQLPRRTVLSQRLDGDRLQSLLSLSPRTQRSAPSTSPPLSSCSASAPILVRRGCSSRGTAHDDDGAGLSRAVRAVQIVTRRHAGPQHAEYQPAKLAAIEGRWTTASPAP